MTEEQMRERMKEIDTEREELKSERQKYENYFYDKKRKELLDDHKKFEGKCFITKNLSENEHRYIKAFKILKVLSEPNERYAECVVLIDGYRSSCWNEFGIQGMTLPLWCSNKLRLMSKETDPKMINMYEEISLEEFNTLHNTYKREIADKISG